ncbi:hypothetical protein L7F22_030354 [Adiantum nelumboides]|nr:hypothetical protein [Adiantum nelumboides]
MKDLGELRYFLGIEMIRNEGGVLLLQKKYGLDMLMKYGMAYCKPILTPLDWNLKLRIVEGEVLDDATMYRRIVGSLIYMTISRPDSSYAVGLVSHYMQLPRKSHLDAVRRIMKYAGSVSDCRSTNGYMFSFGSATITWSSKKQPTIALLSTEAEYRGATVAVCEVAWLKMLFQDLEIEVQDPVVIYCDNISSIQLAQNPVFHARTKHIEVHYHFIKERVLDGDIDLDYVGTEDQASNLFTKALGIEKLRRFRGMLGLQEMALSLRGSVEISSSMPT